MRYITLLITLLIPFIWSFFIFPEPLKDYSGFWNGFIVGGIHGGSFLQNWIINIFSPEHLVKANKFSGIYNFSWWLCLIGTLIVDINAIYKCFSKQN